jgi:hypothetical protein
MAYIPGMHVPTWQALSQFHARSRTAHVRHHLTRAQRVSLAVCQGYAGAKLSDISPSEKENMVERIKRAVRKEGLPALDDAAIEWRISKCLPELRVKKRGKLELDLVTQP